MNKINTKDNNNIKYNLTCGSTESQVKNITNRINKLQNHFKIYKKDIHSKKGLIILVSKRKKLLNFLKKKNIYLYLKLTNELNLRK